MTLEDEAMRIPHMMFDGLTVLTSAAIEVWAGLFLAMGEWL